MAFATSIIAFAAPMLLQSDSARIAGDRVVVEPLAISVAVPQEWLGFSDSTRIRVGSCPSGRRTVFTSPSEVRQLGAPIYWPNQQFVMVADSVVSPRELVAHIGSGEWTREGCRGSSIVRIYVTRETEDAIHMRARTARPAAARGFIPPALARNSISMRDSAGWKMTRVEWSDAVSDAVYNFHIDFITRTLRGRTLLFALMNVGTRTDPQMWGIFRSVLY